MYKILTLNHIAESGLKRLPSDRYQLGEALSDPDAILLRSYKMHDMTLPSSLKAVGRAGAGVNNIPVEKLSQQGIPVFNAPGANANAVKELVIASMLLACRNIAQAWDFARQLTGSDAKISKQVEMGKKHFGGFELPGRTLGVVGLGAIGVEVANAALALGMRVIGFDPEVTIERAWQLSSAVTQASSIDDMVSQVDFISFHVPLIEETTHLINAQRIQLMRPQSVILNFSRSGIIDDQAVIQALDQKRLYAYICDFPNTLVQAHPRVIALPHLGASTREAEENCAIMVADQLSRFLEHGVIKHSVNFPNIDLPRAKNSSRLTVVNSNVPDMVGKIAHALGQTNHNIVHMVNKSRGDIAYTMMDLESTIPQQLLDAICQIDGVLSVRVL